MPEAVIIENKDQRDMYLKSYQNRKLEQVKNKIEEHRNMQLKDKWKRESQWLKNEREEQKKYAVTILCVVRGYTTARTKKYTIRT